MGNQTFLIEACSSFNKLYQVGTTLSVKDDFGVEHKRKLLSEAWILGGHSIVAKFEGISGCYNITRVVQKMVLKQNDLGMSYNVPADANNNPI
jgi:hypothetical protein